MEKTKVIFRKFKNSQDVIAIFPQIPGKTLPYRTCRAYTIAGYRDIGTNYTKSTTELVYRHEYKELYEKLVSIGYDLDVCTRMTNTDKLKRTSACRE